MSQRGFLRVPDSTLPPDVLTKINVQTGTSPVVPAANTITFNGATVAAGTHPVRTDGTGTSTMALEVQISQAIAGTDATKIGLAAFNSTQFTVDANGFVSMVGGSPYISLSPYIVGPDVHSGFATIGAAITQAVADGASLANPKNIYIKPQSGGYTENPALQDGINLVGFSDETVIIGKCTMSTAGTATITGLQLQTNSDYVIEVTGAAASIIYVKDCFINASNNSAIHHTSSSGSSMISFHTCRGDTGTTGIAYFVSTSAGALRFYNCDFEQTGSSSTASTYSGTGGINFYNTFFYNNITTSGTGAITVISCQLYSINAAFIIGGSGANYISNSTISAGTASALSIGNNLIVANCSIDSTNANAITGAGNLKYGLLAFTNTSSTVNTTTLTPLATLI